MRPYSRNDGGYPHQIAASRAASTSHESDGNGLALFPTLIEGGFNEASNCSDVIHCSTICSTSGSVGTKRLERSRGAMYINIDNFHHVLYIILPTTFFA